MYPTVNIDRRQRGIALYRFSPIMLSLLQLIGGYVPLTRVIPPSSQAGPYFVAGLAAAVGHWYAIWGALGLALRRAHGMKRRTGKLVEAMGCTLASFTFHALRKQIAWDLGCLLVQRTSSCNTT